MNDVLKDVGKGTICQPKNPLMHNMPIPAGMFRLALVRPLKGCDGVDPPMQPHGSEEHYSLGGCVGWPLLWTKSQICLAKEEQCPAALAKKARPLVFVAATKRHQQLAAHTPSPPPKHVDAAPNRSDDQCDEINGFLDTRANKGIYMPPLRYPASRGQQVGRPMSCTQRLRFGGGSQETPPEAAATQPNLANVINPTTLHKAVDEQLKSAAPVEDKLKSTAPVDEKKKGWKHSRSKKASSQPSPRKILQAEDGVREEPHDFPMHIAGQPMLTKEMLANTGGAIVNLHNSIQYLEERLLKEKNPRYPVYTIKVPEGHGFVDRSPAEIFYMRYEDIYNLLHSNRLDYNLVCLYTLHMALKAKREKTKGIVIVDPYFMRDVALANEGDRATVKEYLGNIFVENPTIDSILLPCFPE
jgi:hypothetical protein